MRGRPYVKPIKFGCIAPINLLHVIPEHWDFHLILAHLLEDPDYVAFYKARKEKGDTLLLDNSAFEFGEALPADKILALIEKSGIKPDYVVAPDYPGQPWDKTLESTFKFVEDTKGAEFRVMGVPQSVDGDWEGWLDGYRQMVRHPDIPMVGMSILGIPTAWHSITGTRDIMINRLFASQFIANRALHDQDDKFTWHHYLGLSQPNELILQREIGVIDSCDSSSPVWHGVHQIQYDDSVGGLKYGKIKIGVDFHVDLKQYTDSMGFDLSVVEGAIEHNLLVIKQLIG